MDRRSKYSDYSGIHPMAHGRIGDSTVLSCGPPNRMAPNVTVVPGRHQQALRYHEQQQHRMTALHSSDGLYQSQQPSFERYLPAVSYAGYHHSPTSFAPAGLGYVNLGRRETSAYLNHHTHHVQHSHHFYHPPHYDSTYNGRMIGGAGAYHPYREVFEHPQGMPSSVLHYTAAARNDAFRYGHLLSSVPAASQQREYLDYYPCQPFASDHRYAQHNLHSIAAGHPFLSSREGIEINKFDGQHIPDPGESYNQQRQQQQEQSLSASSSSLSSFGISQIASPMTSGSTTTDSGISGSSRCGSTPISTCTTSAGYSGDYSLGTYSGGEFKEENLIAMDAKDSPRSLPATPETSDNGPNSTKDYIYSPKSSCIDPSSSPSENEKDYSGQLCASNLRTDCSASMMTTPERCATPYMSVSRLPTNYHSPQRYPVTHNTWSPSRTESTEAPSSSPKARRKRIITPARTQSPCETKKNRVVECDLIPNKRSRRKSDLFQTDCTGIREEIRDIKPLPGFQQAFGSTEIGRFFETFLNVTPSSFDSVYNYESEGDITKTQPWEIDNTVDGSTFDVQINASLQSMYKNSLGDKGYLSGIRCNGY